jgi:tetratricopeptide (TPR) repeat protein
MLRGLLHMIELATTANVLHPPLEGEGRSHQTKLDFVRCDRGGVIVHPQHLHPSLAPRTPPRLVPCFARFEPTLPLKGRVSKSCGNGAHRCAELLRNVVLAAMVWVSPPYAAGATDTAAPADSRVDPAPCVAAALAGDDDRIVAACGRLIDDQNSADADRVKALVARAGAYDRKGLIDRAIDDDGVALRLDPTLADIYTARGELWRRKGDRPRALQDFAAAIRLDPNQAAAKRDYKSLALELERLGALLAVDNKPSFNCATARRAVEKAICANPELANLDREINAVNARVVGEAGRDSSRAGRALQREQDDFLACRDAAFGRPDFDLRKAMAARLEHLLALAKQ